MLTVAEWDKAYRGNSHYKTIPSDLLDEFLISENHRSPTALDAGCGSGHLVRQLEKRGYHALGVDFSPVAIDLAKTRSSKESRSQYFALDIECDDLAVLPNQPYHVITCSLVYQFMRDKSAFLARMANLLAPDGILIVSVWLEHPHLPLPFDPTPLTDTFDELMSRRDGLYYFVGRKRDNR